MQNESEDEMKTRHFSEGETARREEEPAGESGMKLQATRKDGEDDGSLRKRLNGSTP